jgi:hypothetical protein
MAALGRLLVAAGFALWDLGMDMQYKQELGAILMHRDEFVRSVHLLRSSSNTIDTTTPPLSSCTTAGALHASTPFLLFDTCAVRRNCRNIIDGNLATASSSTTTSTTTTPTAASAPSLSSKKSSCNK